MYFVLGLALGWFVFHPRHSHHRAAGTFTGSKAQRPAPPPPPAPGDCPNDFMWDPVTQGCVPILPWPIQQ